MTTTPDAVVGVDLGGTKIAAALVDPEGRLLGPVVSVPTPAKDGPEAMLDAITLVVTRAHEAGTEDDPGAAVPVRAVGIGAAGVIDADTGTVLSATDAITGWTGVRVAEGVSSRLAARGLGDLPVRVGNDVDAYAEGEAWLGAGRDRDVVLVVAVGTGVGGALCLDGRTLHGAHHVAGEVGHVPVPGAEGEPCTCGRSGHLEAVAAGPQVLRRYHEAGGDPRATSARDVEERAEAGDELALRVYRESATALGTALAGLAAVIDPDRVVISGGLARAGELWWEPLRETLASELIAPLAGLEVVPAELGTTAPIVGAARGAWRLLD